MIPIRQYIVYCFLFSAVFSFSQNENKKWCFGNSAGLDFMTSPPTPFTASGSMNAVNATASIADAAGNLLFYTDGNQVWNKNHVQMANGNLPVGSGSQHLLIAKRPGSTSLYYIFAATGNGLCYTIVDMSLAAGTGSVTLKCIMLDGTPKTHKIAGTFHCNGTDIWIVSQDKNAATSPAYLVTSSGINPTPVVSTLSFINMQDGQLKFSPDGNKLASTDQGTTIQIYYFNSATGVISTPFQIGSLPSPFGVEFSADGSKLYASSDVFPLVLQWDLCAGSTPGAITASQYTVNASGSHKKSIQLGMDGKLYIARSPGQNALAVVNSPNMAGVACNYVETGQSIAPNTCNSGLPNYIKKRPAPVFTNSFNPTSCSTVSFSTKGAWEGVITCATNSANVLWIFGDPGSGGANTSNLYTPTHVFTGPGSYTVKLVFDYNCGTDTTTQTITIAPGPTLSVTGNLNLCEGQSTTLTASGANNYTWTGNGPAITGSVLVANPPGSGAPVYTVTGFGSGGCPGISTVTLNVLPKPLLTISGNTAVCDGSTGTISLSGASSYTWSTGSNSPEISVPSANAAYTVSATAQNGCVGVYTINTISQALPTISVNSATTCEGKPVSLTASGNPAAGIAYSWFPGGQTGNVITVSPSSTTTYSVTGTLNGCSTATTNVVTVNPLDPSVMIFSYNTPVCMNQTLSAPQRAKDFSGGGNFFSTAGIYLNPASGQINPSQSAPGIYLVAYTLAQLDCKAGGQFITQLEILPVPVLTLSPFIKVAPGESATLSVSGGKSYQWVLSPELSCSDCADPVVTPMESKAYCVSTVEGSCKASACIYVEVNCDTGFDFSMPNAFTPDGNNWNDKFCIQGWSACIKSFEVSIFNRWGENVFRSTDPKFCWDGTYKGKLLDADVFVYRISATYRDNKVVSKNGNISLIR